MIEIKIKNTAAIRERERSIKIRIRDLKAAIEATDYKIIKCSEYQLAGLEAPYDIIELNRQRQAIRDSINEAQAEIDRLRNGGVEVTTDD